MQRGTVWLGLSCLMVLALVLVSCAPPETAEEYSNRANSYIMKGEFDKAIADCDKAIELDPDYAEAYGNRGLAYIGKGEFDKAIADFDKMIQLNPENAVAYNLRAACYSEIGEVAKAISDLEKCIEVSDDPELVQIAQKALDKLKQ